MSKRVERLIAEIKKETKLDLFRNTRKREYIEARALLSYFLRNYFGYRLHEIVEVYKRNGLSTHHASILYAIRNYRDTYLPYSSFLKDLDSKMYIKFGNHQEVKLRSLKMLLDSLPESKLDEAKRLIEEFID